MKKNLKKFAGAVIAALLVSFVAVSCDKNTDEPTPTPTQKPTPLPPTPTPTPVPTPADADGSHIHAMILPHGTGSEIKPWSKAADALATDLPAFETVFTAEDYKTLNGKTNRTDALKAAVKKAVDENLFAGRKPKNVIIIFGDGMGESHIVASRKYYGDLIMDLLPYHTPVNHDSYPKPNAGGLDGRVTTDSSAGGTAIVTGFKTRYGYISLDAAGTEVKNLAELAREKGMLVGNVTNDHMGDATPADVSIHAVNRNYQDQIYSKLFLSSPEIAMGSDYGYSSYIQEGVTGDSRKTIKTLFDNYDSKAASKYGADSQEYKDASINLWYNAHATELQKWAIQMLNKFDGKNLTGDTYDFNNWYLDRNMHSYSTFKKLAEAVQADYTIRPYAAYEYNADYDYEPKKGQTAPKFGYKLGYGKKNTKLPTYPEMVALTLSVLDKKAKDNGDCGFYCLIENTVSDGWGHASMPYDCMNEIQCFDEGLAIALKYTLENPDTLLVVTADHETGGLEYRSGWGDNYKRIVSTTSGHASKPVPAIFFGALGDADKDPRFPKKFPDTTNWTDDDWANYVAGKHADFKWADIYDNRNTGILIGKAMGYDHYGDLNGNGILDPDTEYDSIVTNVLPEN